MNFFDSLMQEEMDMTPDLVALSVGIVPDGTEDLSKLLKAPLTEDKFFLEAHVKLRPVELPVDGVYVCGLAHGSKTFGRNNCPGPGCSSQGRYTSGERVLFLLIRLFPVLTRINVLVVVCVPVLSLWCN